MLAHASLPGPLGRAHFSRGGMYSEGGLHVHMSASSLTTAATSESVLLSVRVGCCRRVQQTEKSSEPIGLQSWSCPLSSLQFELTRISESPSSAACADSQVLTALSAALTVTPRRSGPRGRRRGGAARRAAAAAGWSRRQGTLCGPVPPQPLLATWTAAS